MALVFSVARMAAQRILSSAYVDVDALAEHRDALERDRFDVLVRTLPQSSEFLVYDGAGTCLFASTPEIATSVRFEDLFILATTNEDDVYYEVLEYPQSDASKTKAAYEILLCEYVEDTGVSRVIGRCVCDKELRILEGDLFPNTNSLSVEEFALIRGDFGQNMRIGKIEYETTEGEARTLVFASPKMGKGSYQKLLVQSERVWPVAIMVAIVLTVTSVIAVFRVIRGSMRPLNEAIRVRRYRDGECVQEEGLPIELRETYRSFVDLMDVLNTAREENQTLIADVSHDLKTPLAVIGGYAQAFEDGRVPEEDRAAYLHAIYQKSQYANELLDSLLSVAQLDHPAFEPQLAPSDLCEQVRLAVIASTSEVEQSGNTMEVSIADEVVPVLLDKKLFSRILGNLISNACEHNESGTRIVVSCFEENDRGVVVVADDGVGFPEHIRERAFEPFVTRNVARKSGKGTGLGLAIAKKGVESHGGRIYIRALNSQSQNNAIVIELPLCDE